MKSILIIMLCLLMSVSVVGPSHSQTSECAVQTGPQLPDLVVDKGVLGHTQALEGYLYDSMFVTTETFGPNDDNISEGYLPAAGTYTLLHLAVLTRNIGKAGLRLGYPGDCPTLFEFLNGRYRAKTPTAYRVWTQAGWKKWSRDRDLRLPLTGTVNQQLIDAATASGDVRLGLKHWYCLHDEYLFHNATADITPEGPYGYSCTYQGLSPQFADLYGAYTEGQFVDITGLPAGTYVVEVQVNVNHQFPESSYTNNSTYVVWKYGG